MSGHGSPINADADADADASVAGPPEQTGPLKLEVSQLHGNIDRRNNSPAEHEEMHLKKTKKTKNLKLQMWILFPLLLRWKNKQGQVDEIQASVETWHLSRCHPAQ